MLSSFFTRSPSKSEGSDALLQERAVGELRSRLASTEAEAQLRAGGEPGLGPGPGIDEATLHRWLRAEKYDVDKAFSRLTKHAVWRKDYVPDGRIHESEVKNELASEKSFIVGHDKEGRTITYCVVRNHYKSQRDLAETKRFICYSIDAAIQNNSPTSPDGKLTAILDVRDLALDNLDASVLKAIFDLLQEHYPERLGTMFMYKPPTIFWAMWAIVKPFLDPVTQSKVQFLKDASGWAQFSDIIDPEILPLELGGKRAAEPVSETYRRLGLVPKGETLASPPKHLAVDDDGEIKDINDQLHLDQVQASGAA